MERVCKFKPLPLAVEAAVAVEKGSASSRSSMDIAMEQARREREAAGTLKALPGEGERLSFEPPGASKKEFDSWNPSSVFGEDNSASAADALALKAVNGYSADVINDWCWRYVLMKKAKLKLQQLRVEAKEKAKRDAEENLRREARIVAAREAAVISLLAATEAIEATAAAMESVRMAVEDRTRKESEEKARIEVEEQARREAEEMARKKAEEKARKEAERALLLSAPASCLEQL